MKNQNPYIMKTADIKTIEQQHEMWIALGTDGGTNGYFSPEAIELRRQLTELRQKQIDELLKTILCQQQSS